MNCIVVTPEETVTDVSADFVAVPLFDGELGVAPGRAPMIGRLGYGELRIKSAQQTDHFYVDGGFVQVLDNTVTVLTNRALPVAELDPVAAAELLEQGRSRPANSPELMEIRDRIVAQARAQVRLAGKSAE